MGLKHLHTAGKSDDLFQAPHMYHPSLMVANTHLDMAVSIRWVSDMIPHIKVCQTNNGPNDNMATSQSSRLVNGLSNKTD